MKQLFGWIIILVILSSCVSRKKYTESQLAYERLKTNYESYEKIKADLEAANQLCEDKLGASERKLASVNTELEYEKIKVRTLEQQMEYFKSTNTNLLDRLADLSVVSKSGAESIQKSLQALNEQNKYIKELTTSMRAKDSLNLALVVNLKRSLGNIADEDVTIEVKKGVVYISLSDKLLFKSGSAEITPRADEVLGKIAKVVNDHKDLDILVEGHTDNVPIKNSCVEDNWDLSVKRATSVVRILQKKYNVTPSRMTAGGRSEFVPKAANTTNEGKSVNRRTEIIILPKLDQFFQLLEAPAPETKK